MWSVCFLQVALGLQVAVGNSGNHPRPSAAEELLRLGMAAEQRGDHASAITDFRKALAIQPEMMKAHIGLGEALAAAGELDAAIAEDRRVLVAFPDNTEIRKSLAMAYYKKGDLAHAREEFETVHAAIPLDVSTAVLLGYVYIKMGREADVLDLLTPLEAGHESNLDLEYVLAFAMIQSGREAEGIPRMEKYALAKHSADAYVIAGSAHLHRREFREARTDFEAAIRLNPSLPNVHTLAGQAQYALGDSETSIGSFQKALRADPRDFTANLYLGILLLKKHDVENARPLLELALELQPGVPLARLNMAELNALTGKYEEAAKTLEDLERADPDWPEPHIQLATLYYKLHRPEDGKREREIVQQLEAKQQTEGPPDK